MCVLASLDDDTECCLTPITYLRPLLLLIDWEYPGYEPHSGTPDDTVNFNLLLDDVRAALDQLEAETGRYYGLTAALPCGPSIIANQDIAHVGKVLTELNLMTYDFHGSWNEKTGVNAPLYDQEDSPEFSVHGCVENWLEGGASKEKINIGFVSSTYLCLAVLTIHKLIYVYLCNIHL